MVGKCLFIYVACIIAAIAAVTPTESTSLNETDGANPTLLYRQIPTKRIICYISRVFLDKLYTNSSLHSLGTDVDSNHCTHIIYPVGTIDHNKLELKFNNNWPDFDKRFSDRIVAHKQRGIKVSLAIDDDTFSRYVTNGKWEKHFIEHVITFVEKHNFDGLDVDWFYAAYGLEFVCDQYLAKKEEFEIFVADMSTAFKSRELLLSAIVCGTSSRICKHLDVAYLSQHFDWITVGTILYQPTFIRTGELSDILGCMALFSYFTFHYTLDIQFFVCLLVCLLISLIFQFRVYISVA